MRLDRPAGRRSCKTGTAYGVEVSGQGGDWVHICDQERAPHFRQDMTWLRALAESERVMLANEISQKLRTAAAGRLSYGPNGDVELMRRSQVVMEIRLGGYTGETDGHGQPVRHLVRIYFTEPIEAQGYLVTLGIKAKVPGPLGLDEQDKHVAEMDARVSSFELWLAAQGITMDAYCFGSWCQGKMRT